MTATHLCNRNFHVTNVVQQNDGTEDNTKTDVLLKRFDIANITVSI